MGLSILVEVGDVASNAKGYGVSSCPRDLRQVVSYQWKLLLGRRQWLAIVLGDGHGKQEDAPSYALNPCVELPPQATMDEVESAQEP